MFATEQTRMLAEDGYDMNARFWMQADGTWMMSPLVGFGLFAALGTGPTKPKQGGPWLTDDMYMVGGQLPIVLGNDSIWFVVTPRAGLAWGYLGFTDNAKSMVTPAYGLDLSLMFRKAHVGLTTGVVSASTTATGELGRHYDMGGLHLLLTGVIDG